MGRFDFAIQALRAGQRAIVRPTGNSIRPLVKSGASVTLDPVVVEDLKTGDVVLCRVAGSVCLHLVTCLQGGRVQIGNNHGNVNGWTRTIYGRAFKIENP